MLPVSLDCLHPVSSVPNVASVSDLHPVSSVPNVAPHNGCTACNFDLPDHGFVPLTWSTGPME